MTGGQMAPTTLVGQKTTTTPKGETPDSQGILSVLQKCLPPLTGLHLLQGHL